MRDQQSIQLTIKLKLHLIQLRMPPKKDPKAVEQPPKQPDPEPLPHELTGFGRFQYISGVVYEGNWTSIKGKKMKHGYGKMTLPSRGDLPQQSYEGCWHQDQMQGLGIYKYPDGSIYDGEWQQDKHHGQGIFTFANGTKYVGQWKSHLLQGQGEFTDHLGRTWKGQYRGGSFQSRNQIVLVTSIVAEQRKKQQIKEVRGSMQQLLSLLESQDRQGRQAYRIKSYMDRNQSINKLTTAANLDYKSKSKQQWISFFSELRSGKYILLEDRKDSSIVHPDQVMAQQLVGTGQIVQVYTENGSACAWMLDKNKNWLVIGIKET